MKFKNSITAIILMAAVMLTFATANAQGKPEKAEKKWAEGRIIVKPRAGVSEEKFAQILNRSGGHSKAFHHQINVHIVNVPPQAEEAIIKALLKDPNIEFAEKDMIVELSSITPNDPKFGSQWHLPKMQVPDAWNSTAGAGITVAILDTGVEANHPDLVDNLVPGWNVVSNNSDTSPAMWHGTSVAGVVAATSNNSTGVASIAWNAKIMPIRITNQSNGNAYWSDVAAGLVWAADHGADVANISYMVTNSSTVANAAQYLRNKGGVVVVAAGNDNTDPGFNDSPYMITVAATDSSDSKAGFSNYGNLVDVSAPGKDIYTTYTNGGYAKAWGTSFASPATAGVVALIMAANPDLTPEEVEAVLEQSADDPIAGTDWHQFFGHGRVNAAAAVQLAQGVTDVDTQAPSTTIFSPQNNATVSGNVLVEVNATDDTGVTGVDLYADGQFVGRDMIAPYQFSWDSTQIADGSVMFTAYAQDSAENEGISVDLSVNVVNQPEVIDTTPPTVSIVSPIDGSTVSGNVLVEVNASDDTDVTGVDLYADGQFVDRDSSAPYSFSWDSTQVADGNVIFTAYAQDSAGNEGISNSLSIALTVSAISVELIIDNTNSNTSYTGAWKRSSGTNPWDSDSLYSSSGSTFRWNANISTTGTYAVYAWWTYYSNRSTAAPYTIQHDGGTHIVSVNQRDQSLASKWVYLGEYSFSAGSAAFVELSSESANGTASADAVRFVSTTTNTPVNTAPVFNQDPINESSVEAGQTVIGSLSGSASDADGDQLTYSKTSGPAWLNVAANGELTGTPSAADEGINSFVVQVTDGKNSDSATLNIEVTLNSPVNTAPVFNQNPINESSVEAGQTVIASLSGSASDADGDQLTYSKTSGPAWLNVAANGELTGTPSAADEGINSFEVQVTDGEDSDNATLNIDVTQPASAITVELIIDNTDSNASYTGRWKRSSGINPWDSDSLYSSSGSTFRWNANISTTGTYAVYAWWTYYNNRSTAAPYTIQHDGGTNIVSVNQRDQSLAGKWVYLGDYSFSAGSAAFVELSSESANGTASADAIKLVKN